MRTKRLLGAVAALAALAVVAFPSIATAASPPVNAADPVISGTAREGQTLTASSGSWGGTLPISYNYAWQRCDTSGANCKAISGASNPTYKLVTADVGSTVRVKVTAANSAGTASVFSLPTGVVAALGTAPAATSQPSPSGNAVVGQTLTADNGTWSGATPMTFTYQWQTCTAQNPTCNDIKGETSKTYVVKSADIGRKLRYIVTADNSAGKGTVNSNLSAVVVDQGKPPVNLEAPVIYGDPTVGHVVTVSTGEWSGIGKSANFDYAWDRCTSSGSCTAIAAAKSNTYAVTSTDAGQRLRARVTAKNGAGSTSATSASVAVATSTGGGGGGATVPVSSLKANPDHLLIDQVKYNPATFSNPGGSFQMRVHVQLEGTNKSVSGALVYVTCIPYNWVKAQPPETPTGSDGWVTLTVQTTTNLPRSGALVMQVRARGPGNSEQDILGGISTRRLVQISLK
jgi:hypothetical protein